jgi:hypothetical protein
MLDDLPSSLLGGAYLSQTGEPAWPRVEALQVISWATKSEIPILGVEIWIPTTPGPTIPMPYFYAFEPESNPGESETDFIVRANDATADYVRSFDWDSEDKQHHGVEPFFNLTLGDKKEKDAAQ